MTAILENDKYSTIDAIEALALENYPLVECKTEHFFIPGIYARKCTMPAGSMVTSCIHLQEHPFKILSGDVSVWTEDVGWQRFKAPYCGITKPGTRRVLINHEETVWITFQSTSLTNPEEIERELMDQHSNPLVPESISDAARSICRGDVRYLETEERIG